MSADARVTLSTGQTVSLPLSPAASMRGLVVTAGLDAVRAVLPPGLAPVRCRPGRGMAVLLSVTYDRIGDDAVAPYEEFGLVVPATTADGAVPELCALRRGVGGYVVALPVTTDPARALGVEVWGYPKSVLDISIGERGARRRTLVRGPTGHALTLDVPDSPSVATTARSASYTDGNGSLCRQSVTLRGAVGARPFPLGAAYRLGDHSLAADVRALDPGWPLLALSFDGEFVIGRGEQIRPD
jgi:hypothetical protein